jgi:hypothetical protein
MSSPDYEVDEQGNLVEAGAPAATEGEEQTVTPEEARRFLRVLAFSEVWSVGVAALAAYFAFPGEPLLIAAAAIVWAIVSAGAWLFIRNNVRSRIKRPG